MQSELVVLYSIAPQDLERYQISFDVRANGRSGDGANNRGPHLLEHSSGYEPWVL